MSSHDCVRDLLSRGLDDWVYAAEVASVAREIGGAVSPEEVRDISLRLIRELLEGGLFEAGEITNGEFVAWPGDGASALRRIAESWNELPNGPSLGDICWFNLTKEGEIAAQCAARETR